VCTVSLPESMNVAVVAEILAEEKAKKALQTAEDIARGAAAFNGLRCTLADSVVAAHSRAVAAAASAEEHAQLLRELLAALSAAGSFMDAQREPAIQSARWVQLHPSERTSVNSLNRDTPYSDRAYTSASKPSTLNLFISCLQTSIVSVPHSVFPAIGVPSFRTSLFRRVMLSRLLWLALAGSIKGCDFVGTLLQWWSRTLCWALGYTLCATSGKKALISHQLTLTCPQKTLLRPEGASHLP
jgi:hypothetical protein